MPVNYAITLLFIVVCATEMNAKTDVVSAWVLGPKINGIRIRFSAFFSFLQFILKKAKLAIMW